MKFTIHIVTIPLFFLLLGSCFGSTNENELENIGKNVSCPAVKNITWKILKDSSKGYYTSFLNNSKLKASSPGIYRFEEKEKKPIKFIRSFILFGNKKNSLQCAYEDKDKKIVTLITSSKNIRFIALDDTNWYGLTNSSPLITSTKECHKSVEECSVKIIE